MPGPSVLEYARYHGLSTPCTDADLSKYLRTVSYASIDESTLSILDLPSKDGVLSQSKLQLSGDVATSLADMIAPPEKVRSEAILSNPFRFRDLKVEHPLLFSDHEKDMRSFKKPLNLGRIMRELRECTDQEELGTVDEVTFIARCDRAAATAEQMVHLLRLETTEDALEVLARSTDDHASEYHLDDLYKAHLGRVKKKQTEAPSPLLTPPMRPVEIEVPSLAGDWSLEPRSDQEVAFDNLAGHFQHRIAESDLSELSNGSPTKIRERLVAASAPIDIVELDPEIELAHDKNTSTSMDFSKLKLDIPPLDLPHPPSRKEERAQDLLDDFINELIELPSSPETSEQVTKQKKMEQELQECQGLMENDIDQEQPTVNADLLRITVTDMPSVLPGGPESLSLTHVADDHLIVPYLIEPREESRLNWIPFPTTLMRPDLREELHGGVDVGRYLATPQKVTASKDLLWKETGLRFLDERPEDLEELILDVDSLHPYNDNKEPPHTATVATLHVDKPTDNNVRAGDRYALFQQNAVSTVYQGSSLNPNQSYKAKPGVNQEDLTESSSEISSPSLADARPAKRPRLSLLSTNPIPFRKTVFPSQATAHRAFSASGSLASFLDLRGKRFRKSPLPEESAADPVMIGGLSGASQDTIECSQNLVDPLNPTYFNSLQSRVDTNAGVDHSEVSQDIQVPSTPEKSQIAMLPTTPATVSESRVIVLDEALVRNRALMALLDQHADEPVRAIYRNLGGTADLVLNPTTGVILTNIQALKQKSLPGQSTTNSRTLQDRIAASSTQYETIFILVSLAFSALEYPPETINDFTAFCIGLQATGTRIHPIWLAVPTAAPGQITVDLLMAWTWGLICQHSLKIGDDMSFIDDTTLWELFLREAGINALAAQLMLGMLKRDSIPPGVRQDDVAMDGVNVSGNTVPPDSWGLRRLVAMSEQEREDKFGRLVGEKCLARLSAILDPTSITPADR